MQSLANIFATPGIGGVLVLGAVVVLTICFGLTINWISKGGK